MGNALPPPIPKGRRKEEGSSGPVPVNRPVPTHEAPAQQALEPAKKTNHWLWIVPTIIIVLLIVAGVGYYFHQQAQEAKEKKERLRQSEEDEEREQERQQAIADSIAEAQRMQAYEDSVRMNFTSPALELFSLTGHVKSVHTSAQLNSETWPTNMIAVFNNKDISYTYDGDFASLRSDLNDGYTPWYVDVNSSGYLTKVDNSSGYGQDVYHFNWHSGHLSSTVNAMDNASITDTYKNIGAHGPEVLTQEFHNSMGDSRSLTCNITYSDFDAYGNWTRATIHQSGSYTQVTSEWDEYTETYQERTQTHPVDATIYVSRYIQYWE